MIFVIEQNIDKVENAYARTNTENKQSNNGIQGSTPHDSLRNPFPIEAIKGVELSTGTKIVLKSSTAFP